MAAGTIRVTLISGVSRLENLVVDDCVTVQDLADDFGDNLGIPAGAVALVNGRAAKNTQTVRNGDEVSWNKPTGSKG